MLFYYYTLVLACAQKNDYPSIDGYANNLKNPHWGSVEAFFLSSKKAIPTANLPEDFAKLPSPRLISNLLGQKMYQESTYTAGISAIPVSFGQTVSHDFAFTSTNKSDSFPISVPKCDFNFDETCSGNATIPFNRFASAEDNLADPHRRRYKSKGSQFLHASWLYGYSGNGSEFRDTPSSKLRLPNGIFPFREEDEGKDVKGVQNCPLLHAADSRVNENIGMSSVFVMFAREHNAVVDYLEMMHPEWDEEVIFQEARRRLIAIYQKIIYEEYSSKILGMNPAQESAAGSGYDANVDATVSMIFTVAACRYGHSGIPGHYIVAPKWEGQGLRYMASRDANMNSCPVIQDFDGVMRGQLYTAMQPVGASFVNDMRNHVITVARNEGHDSDLLAIDIQRGRDVGLPPYNDAREEYGLPRVRRWEYFAVSREDKANLETLYGSAPEGIDRLDVFVGGLLEPKEAEHDSKLILSDGPGSAFVGPLFARIMRDQFIRSRSGDRYFFEWDPEMVDFVKDVDIRKLIYRNTRSKIPMPQGSAFDLHSFEPKPVAIVQEARSGSSGSISFSILPLLAVALSSIIWYI